jgi:kinesin family protein 5
LGPANKTYVPPLLPRLSSHLPKSNPILTFSSPHSRFEVQLAAVKDRLEAAKAGSTRGLGSPTGIGGFNIGSRIAKPLRGGGDSAGSPSSPHPTFANLQQQNPPENKRSSWFFQKS